MGLEAITLAQVSQAVGVVSSIYGAITNAQAASYQAAVAARNQQIAEENARNAVETSQREAQDWGESARQQLGAMVSELSASGGRLNAGSSLLQRKAAESLSYRDTMRIREEGNLKHDAFQQQAADFQAEGSMARKRRGFALVGGALGALDSYISGAQRISRIRRMIE